MGSNDTFNLVHEPWIKCRTAEGNQLLSIRQVFDGSAKPLAVVGDSPTQDYAVLRVLLAIFWRAHYHEFARRYPSPRSRKKFEWDTWFLDTRETLRETGKDEVVLGYLAEVEDRFDLLHPTVPFMQVADLHTAKNTNNEIARILPDSEGSYFTMRTGPGRVSISYDEAARWLVHTQAYDYSGIKSGAVGDPRVKGGRGYPIGQGWSGLTGGTVIRGANLLETLVLNTTESCVPTAAETDKPVWEREPDTAAPQDLEATQPKGPADLATWQSRRIRLFTEDGAVTRVLVSNGDRIPNAGLNVFGDPMTPYRFSKNKSKKDFQAYYPRPYDEQRTTWRSLDALVAVDGDPGFSSREYPPQRPKNVDNVAHILEDREVLDLQIVSMAYGPQSSTYGTIVSSSIGLPVHLLRNSEWSRAIRNDVRNSAEATGRAATALGAFAGQLYVAAGGEYEFGADVADRLYAQLEPRFHNWMRDLDPKNMAQEVSSWQHTVREAALGVAQNLLNGAGQKALIGRLLDEDSGGRVINAGTVFQQLKRKLNEELPLTAPQKTKSEEGEGNGERA